MENKEHLFEKAGLGIAPFHCVDVYKDVTGGSCDYCGTGIKFFCIINDKNGKKFKVGTECVLKCSPELYAQVKKERAALLASLRAEKNSAERKARFAAQKAKEAANLEAFKVAHPEEFEFLKAAADYQKKIMNELNSMSHEELCNAPAFDGPKINNFLCSLYTNIAKWGNLSENQMNAVRRSIAESKKKPSEYLGVIGKRMEFNLTILHKIAYENDWGGGTVFIMQDAEGNKVIYKGSGYIEKKVFLDENDPERYDYVYAQVGDNVKIVGGVKAHSEYKGEKQTIIQRIKTLDISTQTKK